MAMELETFASGDTDYIAKLNANVATLTEAITSLQVQVGAVSGGDALSVGLFMDALFNRADALIGPASYKATKSGTTLTIAPGGMYLASEQSVVMSNSNVPLSFTGRPADTYYVMVDTVGNPSLQTTVLPGSIYSVVWSGTAFGVVTYQVAIFFDTTEADASRKSTVLGTVDSPPDEKSYATLDARLEANESIALNAKDTADEALSAVYELEASIPSHVRKVGITVDGTTGVKGAIQVDFDGTIIGWSAVADVVGSLTVEVDVKPSLAPPAVPGIPNTTTDKISASAPIALSGAQSASRAESGVSTWFRGLSKWDVIQFNVTAVTTIARATVYLRIQETLPSPPVINPEDEMAFEDIPLFPREDQ